MNWRLWVPLFAFALFIGLAAYQLTQPRDDFVESRMVGQELPYFDLPPASPMWISPTASRACSISGRAGVCPASQKRRISKR